MKRILYLILISSAVLSSCQKEEEQAVKKALEVVLSKSTLDMNLGETATLTARTLPADVDQNVVWSVMDPEIATVENGVITAVSAGVTYVVATSADNAAKSSCFINVTDVPDYEFLLTDSNGNIIKQITAYPGYTTRLDVLTTDYKLHNFSWTSSDPSAVHVNKNGEITLKPVFSKDPEYVFYGEAMITIKADDGNGFRFKVISSISSKYLFDQEEKKFGDMLTIPAKSSHSVTFRYFNGEGLVAVPSSVYTLSSSSSDVQVKKNADGWMLNVPENKAGTAQITFSIGELSATLAEVTAEVK